MWKGTYFANIFCPGFKIILLSLFLQPIAGPTRRHCQLGLEVHAEGALQSLHQVQASQLEVEQDTIEEENNTFGWDDMISSNKQLGIESE